MRILSAEDILSLKAETMSHSEIAISQSKTVSRSLTTRWVTIAWAVAAIVMLPLIGVMVVGRSIRPYLEFPPITHSVSHEPFSWPIFIALGVLFVGAIGLGAVRIFCTGRHVSPLIGDPNPPRRIFPWWGWLAALWTLVAWLLAWSRFEWMRSLQAHTFAPLWLGYIVVVNALTFRRIGHCMLLHRPRYFLPLFPLSAGFWWFFEYLNRFVQNWHYVGGGELSEWEYLVRATLPFSTVLPAVLGTAECLTALPRCSAGLDRFVTFEFKNRMTWGWGLLMGSAVGLFGLGLWPDYLFSLVWVAPLLLITSLQLIRDEPTIFSGTAQGDWRMLWAAALAALICGCFWEMWNFYSLARWEYAVPFVQRFTLFEMPLLGYAGYLPFGLECLAVADLCLSRKFSGGVAYYRAAEGGTDLAQRKPTVAER